MSLKVVAAIDSFKGSMSSLEAGQAAREGILRAVPDACVQVCPLADGGEGTMEALVEALGGERRQVEVAGPLGTPVTCTYGIIPAAKTAVMEMSQAAGITLVPEEKRNPMDTTTFGVGEIIRDAIEKGCRKFIMGIGGSATNDGGAGMLMALGYDLLDQEGRPIPYGAAGLEKLVKIGTDHVLPQLSQCTFTIACDVDNPLCGSWGCSAVFGPQKGADEAMIRQMDQWLERFAHLAKTVFQDADSTLPGSGAAGGLGFALRTFLNGNLESGIQIVIRETGLEAYIRDADVVITGEGRLDEQTAMGKAPAGVASLGKKYKKTVIAVAGSVASSARVCNEKGIDAYFPILRGICTLQEAMAPENAKRNMADTVEQIFRLFFCLDNTDKKRYTS